MAGLQTYNTGLAKGDDEEEQAFVNANTNKICDSKTPPPQQQPPLPRRNRRGGMPAFIAAARSGDLEYVQSRIPYEDINQKSAGGFTALTAACANGQVKVVELLLEQKAIDCSIETDGKNAMQLALERSQWDVVELLHVFGKFGELLPPLAQDQNINVEGRERTSFFAKEICESDLSRQMHFETLNRLRVGCVAKCLLHKSFYFDVDTTYELFQQIMHHDPLLPPIVVVKRAPRFRNIGVFALHPAALGSDYLTINPKELSSSSSSLSSRASSENQIFTKIVSQLGGNDCSSFYYLPQGIVSLGPLQLDILRNYVDSSYDNLLNSNQEGSSIQVMRDFKVFLTRSELEDLVGEAPVRELSVLFGEKYDDIVIRRCQSHGDHINFHVDFSRKTMQVALNGDDEYVGGRLAFIRNSALEIPDRPSGAITIHEGDIVHGVTELQSGIRYGLFFIQKQDENGKRGNAWLQASP